MAEERRAFEVPDHVVFRKLDDEMVLLNLDSGEYFGLNDTGARIWELIAEGATAAEAAGRLAGEFVVEPGVAADHVRQLCNELVEAGLLRAAAPGG